jgi:hypothetical protein
MFFMYIEKIGNSQVLSKTSIMKIKFSMSIYYESEKSDDNGDSHDESNAKCTSVVHFAE